MGEDSLGREEKILSQCPRPIMITLYQTLLECRHDGTYGLSKPLSIFIDEKEDALPRLSGSLGAEMQLGPNAPDVQIYELFLGSRQGLGILELGLLSHTSASGLLNPLFSYSN
jgi:hypothetical protein